MIPLDLYQRMQQLIHYDGMPPDEDWEGILADLDKHCTWEEANRYWLRMCEDFDRVHAPEEFNDMEDDA